MVVALQFYSRDWWRAAKLARLLADLEQRRRDDVCLLFVRTTECPATRYLEDTIARCAEVFHVESLVIHPDTEARRERWGQLALAVWPVGCNVLWAGAAEYVLRGTSAQWTTVFFVDGGDGAPLHRNWVDLALSDHYKTLRAGLSVTGSVLQDGCGRWHVNGNVLVEKSFLDANPEVLVMPGDRVGWDVHHASSFLPECRASTLVHCDWRQVGARAGKFPEVAAHSAWWHGCKDGNFVDLAREYVLGGARPRPAVLDLGRASDVVGGRVPDLLRSSP